MNEWQTNQQQSGEKEIDILRLLQVLWKWAWLIAVITMIAGIATYLYSASLITPTYRSYFTAYVNNRIDTTEGNNSTTTSDLNASAALTYLYQDIIVSRSVLLDAAEACGMEQTYDQIRGKVFTSVASNSALITVYVTDEDPALATQLAKAIADVAPAHVERVREGSSMRILDSPVVPTGKYAPSNGKNAMIGGMVGFVLSVGFALMVDLLNNRVRDSEDLEQRYNLIVIGVIPDLTLPEDTNSYAYGYAKAGGEKK